jgi:hypothetical protein
VPYYVPLGPRGHLIRVGTFLLGLWGGVIYEVLRRRRGLLPTAALPPLVLAESLVSD